MLPSRLRFVRMKYALVEARISTPLTLNTSTDPAYNSRACRRSSRRDDPLAAFRHFPFFQSSSELEEDSRMRFDLLVG